MPPPATIELYRVPKVCRWCGGHWLGHSFLLPLATETEPRWGKCDPCLEQEEHRTHALYLTFPDREKPVEGILSRPARVGEADYD